MGHKLAIIDPVGIKSGMNHYDTFLCLALEKFNIEPYIYSNFEIPSKTIVTKSYFGTFFKSKILQTLNFLTGMIQSCWHCKIKRIDTVIVHVFSTHNMAFLTYLICRFFRLKIITISHDVFSFTQQDNKRFHDLIYNHWSEKIVVHNKYSYDQLISQINAKVHDRVSVIKHGAFVDLPNPLISKSIARNELGLDEDRQYILFFGRIKSTKRLDLLLRALPLIDASVHLIIAGHTGKEDFGHYQSIIDELNLSDRIVLDINYITEEKRELYFKATDTMALPYELIFQSGVLLMALSYGIPVVATRIPPFEEVLKDGESGLLFESDNQVDLAQKFNSLLNDKELLNNMPQKAIDHMKTTFSWHDIAANYVKLLELH